MYNSVVKNNPKKEITLDDLALMVAKGFNDMDEKMNKEFKEVKTDIKEIKQDIRKIKTDTGNVQADINKKVDRFTHNDLTYRVEKLEKKLA